MFLLFEPRACYFACCLGPGAGPFFLLFGPVACCFFAVSAGGVFFLFFGRGREFTHSPVCLACLQATQQKKDQAAKKNTGSGLGSLACNWNRRSKLIMLKIDHKGASILQTQKVEPYYGNIDCRV